MPSGRSARKKAASSKVHKGKIVNVFIGEFDKPLDKVAVYATQTIKEAIEKSNMGFEAKDEINDSNGRTVQPSSKVKANEDYFIVRKYTSGQ